MCSLANSRRISSRVGSRASARKNSRSASSSWPACRYPRARLWWACASEETETSWAAKSEAVTELARTTQGPIEINPAHRFNRLGPKDIPMSVDFSFQSSEKADYSTVHSKSNDLPRLRFIFWHGRAQRDRRSFMAVYRLTSKALHRCNA